MSSSDADGDFLERLLFPQGKEELEQVFEHGRKLVDRVIDMISPIDSESIFLECFRSFRNVRDLDYVHFLFFACIPTVADVTEEIQKRCPSPARWERFLNELVFCRSTLIDGLTPSRTACKTNVDAHFKSMRHFVAHMREFYLLRSDSPKRRFFDPTIPLAFWDSTEKIATCVDFAKEGGSAFFHIIGIIVFCDFATTYCGDSKAVFADAKSSVKCSFQDVPDDPTRKIQSLPYQAIFPRPLAQLQTHRLQRRPVFSLQRPPSEAVAASAVVLNVPVSAAGQ